MRISDWSSDVCSSDLSDGQALLRAQKGRYDMDTERVAIDGPVQFQSEGGYRLTTRDVGVDLKTRRMQSAGRVDGRLPIGTFSGDHLEAALSARTVRVNGRASWRIEQKGLKGQRW